MDLAYWQRLGDQLGWRSQFRDDAWNLHPGNSEPRKRGYVHYGIIHHTATPNEAVAVDLMMPGGRLVTCNRITGTDGKFRRNIPEDRRAYTSASWLDDIADTTEVVNTSGGPGYGMSDLSIMALAIWMVEKFRAGRLKEISRRYIIGHYEVLGISGAGYATSCPGPNTTEADRRLDMVTELAQHFQAGRIGPSSTTTQHPSKKGNPVSDVQYYARVDNGQDSGEWMIGGVELFDDPSNDPGVTGYHTRDGFWVTEELDVALTWARQYSYYPPETRAVRLERDDYIKQQAVLRDLHEKWRAGQAELIKAVVASTVNAILDARETASAGA